MEISYSLADASAIVLVERMARWGEKASCSFVERVSKSRVLSSLESRASLMLDLRSLTGACLPNSAKRIFNFCAQHLCCGITLLLTLLWPRSRWNTPSAESGFLLWLLRGTSTRSSISPSRT